MIVSTVVSAIAFTTIVVVTIVLANQTKTAKEDLEGRLRNVVDQVNTSQQYSYEFDKRQQQQVTGLERNVDEVRTTYITKSDAARKLSTQQMDAKVVEAEKVNLASKALGDGSLQFNSRVDGASKSPDYLIQRGAKGTENHLVIHTPAASGAGVNFMSSGGKSRMFVDGNSGQVNVTGNLKTSTLQLGDKFKMSGVGDGQANDDWLRLTSMDGKTYKGGLAASRLYAQNETILNGKTDVNGLANVRGNLYIRGGNSVHNPNKWDSHFPFTDGKNYIRGDTELRGNLENIGDITVGKNQIVNQNLTVRGTTDLAKPVRVNHTQGGDVGSAPISAYAAAGQVGASFGSDGWSHFPWKDGNTYIRPGQDNRNILIGDWGASGVQIGRGNTNTVVKGTLTAENPGWNWMKVRRNNDDEILIGSDDTNRGIWNNGPRDFSIYTSGANRFSVNKDGLITNRGDVAAPSVGRATNDNDWFRINNLNANNPRHPGTAVYQGMSINQGGGLSVGDWRKVPEGQAYVRNALKVRHNQGGWTDNAAISTWTPPQSVGASFGGPTHWSHFPWADGNTYIRPGADRGIIKVGDAGASHVHIGADNGGTEVRLGPHSWLPFNNGHSYIRPGRENHNVYVGDWWTNEVNLGRTDGGGSVITRPWRHNVRRHLDAWDNWDQSGKTLFNGWYSDKTVIGNSTTGGTDYVKNAPKNTVVSANDLRVYGKATASSSLCINDTCLNEGDIKKLKSWL